ncbi:DUF6470 family protein [Clostridiaceae bacterium M8S5]|nr:DUF6470 family protein [Clostridiaceae bacterium M8S5]
MKLSIRTTNAQLGIKTTNAQMNLRQPKGEQSIKQISPRFEVDCETPRVIIDQYQCFAESGLKSPSDLSKENTQLAKQKAIEGIRRRVENGNRLANIKVRMPEALSEIAARNYYPQQRVFDVVTMPRSRPKIDVVGHLNINWKLGEAQIAYKVNKPTMDYKPGKVDIYLEREFDIDIQWIDEKNQK